MAKVAKEAKGTGFYFVVVFQSLLLAPCDTFVCFASLFYFVFYVKGIARVSTLLSFAYYKKYISYLSLRAFLLRLNGCTEIRLTEIVYNSVQHLALQI